MNCHLVFFWSCIASHSDRLLNFKLNISECLDGAQQYLHPEHGISIPQSYTSYVAPLGSAKLWNMAKQAFPREDSVKVTATICCKNFEIFLMNAANGIHFSGIGDSLCCQTAQLSHNTRRKASFFFFSSEFR